MGMGMDSGCVIQIRIVKCCKHKDHFCISSVSLSYVHTTSSACQLCMQPTVPGFRSRQVETNCGPDTDSRRYDEAVW